MSQAQQSSSAVSTTAASINANATAREAMIEEYLKALKLPGFAASYEGLARQARDGGWDYEEFLAELLDAESRSREERTAKRRLKEAKFPEIKTLDQLDYGTLQGISRQKLAELSRCEFLAEALDCIVAGPVGTGKTHVAISIGVEAARRRYKVAFYRAADLVRMLTESRDERTLTALHRRIRRVDLLILDELGFVPFERAGGELLFDLLSERHELRSTMITTNLAFGEWVFRSSATRSLRRRCWTGSENTTLTSRPLTESPTGRADKLERRGNDGRFLKAAAAAFSRWRTGWSGSTLQRCSAQSFGVDNNVTVRLSPAGRLIIACPLQ